MPATINDRDRQKVNQSEVLAQYNQAELPKTEADLREEAQNARRMFDLPQEFFGLSTIVVCSIWPEPLDSQPFTHGGIGRKVYRIEAGSIAQPAYMVLQNTFDMIIQQIGQEKGSYPATIPAASYGNDIIRYWTGDHPANTRGKKGIGIIKGHVVGGRIEATPHEIADLERLQNGYLDYLIERADNYWDRGEREKIGLSHKRALSLRNQDITLHPWFRSRVQMFNECPNCAELIKSDAVFCKVCSQNIVDYFIKYNEVPDAAKWPRVYKLYERMTATANTNKK